MRFQTPLHNWQQASVTRAAGRGGAREGRGGVIDVVLQTCLLSAWQLADVALSLSHFSVMCTQCA